MQQPSKRSQESKAMKSAKKSKLPEYATTAGACAINPKFFLEES
ncbi:MULTISPECIES: hypothetical protein [unclassified Calothrix]|nr:MULTISPECIES: hypothetical protein [unclassified Calothrix]